MVRKWWSWGLNLGSLPRTLVLCKVAIFSWLWPGVGSFLGPSTTILQMGKLRAGQGRDARSALWSARPIAKCAHGWGLGGARKRRGKGGGQTWVKSPCLSHIHPAPLASRTVFRKVQHDLRTCPLNSSLPGALVISNLNHKVVGCRCKINLPHCSNTLESGQVSSSELGLYGGADGGESSSDIC